MTKAIKLLTALPPPQRQRLMTLAREVSFPEDTRIFEADGPADRFWVIRSGAVSLDQQVNSLQRVTVASPARAICSAGHGCSRRTPGTSARWPSARCGPTSSTRRPC